MEPNPYEAPKETGYVRAVSATGTRFSLLPYLALVAALVVAYVAAGTMFVVLSSR